MVQHPLSRAMRSIRLPLGAVILFSFVLNLLMLTAPLYMLQIYDRVLISRSTDTLVLLTAVALGALILLGLLETTRTRVMVRVGGQFNKLLSPTVFATSMSRGSGSQPFRDQETVRVFMTGSAMLALFDAPWTPLYIALIYVLHPWLGHVALLGALGIFSLALLNELLTRHPLRQSASEMAQANQFADSGSRNRDVILAMGMLPGLARVWHGWHDAGIAFQSVASDAAGFIAGSVKLIRFAVQIGVLGTGAYLVIHEQITPGVMIAASIVSGRALAPVEMAIQGWRSFLLSRAAYQRLYELLQTSASEVQEPTRLPAPRGEISFQSVYASPPGIVQPVITAASFRLPAGTSLGISGPSAAGKSSIARLMVGVWQPTSGEVRLDGAELSQWDRAQLGLFIGYLPQDVELFAGSVAENIARFGPVDDEAVVAAAQLAGAHETILSLPEGYDSRIGPGGENLSGGQRQRVGIARALYRSPPLVVLDEPTSNLDASGEDAVRRAVEELTASGSTVVVIAHRPCLIAGVDNMMVVQKGVITHLGTTQEVMPQVTRRVVTNSA